MDADDAVEWALEELCTMAGCKPVDKFFESRKSVVETGAWMDCV